MKKKFLSLAAILIMSCLIVSNSWATEARSQARLYNLAFEDQTDVFLFPHLLNKYKGLYLYLPSNPSDLYGGIILGIGDTDHTIGVFVHRNYVSPMDQHRMSFLRGTPVVVNEFVLNSTTRTSGSSSPTIDPMAGQVIDLMYGNGRFGAGLRLHGWSEISTQEGQLVGSSDIGTSDPHSAFALSANAGLNLMDVVDLRLGFSLRKVKSNFSSSAIFFSARHISNNPGDVKLVVLGELQLGFGIPNEKDTNNDGTDDIGSAWMMTIPVKAGAIWNAYGEELVIAALAGVDLQMGNGGTLSAYGDAGDDDEATSFGIALPTLEIGAEWRPIKRVGFRAAAKGGWGVTISDDDPDSVLKPKKEMLVVSSGFSIYFDAVEFDAVIQYDVWNNGTYLLSGSPGHIFGAVSMSFKFGDPGQVSPTPVVATPQPAPNAFVQQEETEPAAFDSLGGTVEAETTSPAAAAETTTETESGTAPPATY